MEAVEEIIEVSPTLTIVVDKGIKFKEGELVYDYKEKRVEIATHVTEICQTSISNIHAKVVATIGENDFVNIPVRPLAPIDKMKKEITDFMITKLTGSGLPPDIRQAYINGAIIAVTEFKTNLD